MPQHLAFDDLIAKFAAASVPASKLKPDYEAARKRGVLLEAAEPNFFIPPDLQTEESRTTNPFFWLISAPAAVGKSLLARQLSRKLTGFGRQTLYVPLAGHTIGENFFTGLVTSIFPNSAKSEVMDSIRAGSTLLIFDGYDELSMTLEQSRLNKDFVEDIRNELLPDSCRSVREAPSVIFLYRSAIKSFGIFDALLGDSLPLDLEYFSPGKQAQFLADYTKTPLAAAAYTNVLDVLKQHLAPANEEATQTFFGHAPVLMALGDLILEEGIGNPMRIAQELVKGDFPADKGVGLVKRIIQQLLEREDTKFSRQIFDEKGLTSFHPYPVDFQKHLLNLVLTAFISSRDWGLVVEEYLTEECPRRLADNSTFAALSANDRKSLEEQYIQETTSKIRSHPFVDLRDGKPTFTNPIYREKFLAEYLVGIEEKQIPRILEAYRAPSYYLAQFILDILPGRDLNARNALTFYVLRSLSMATGDEFEAEISWQGGRWQFSVSAGGFETTPFWYGDPLLLVVVPDGEILESVTIEGGNDTVVGLDVWQGQGYKRRLTLSRVSVEAGEIDISATEVNCDAVTLEGKEIRFGDQVETIGGIDTLSVLGEVTASQFIRRKYKNTLVPTPGSADAEKLRQKLKAMLVWFRKHGKEDYGIFDKRFRTVVLKKGRDDYAKRVTEFLYDQHILGDKPGMVVLDQDQLARYGLHYLKQNEISFEEGFSDLVERWAKYGGN